MITLRKAGDRGQTDLGWLTSRHSFSFGDYYDPDQLGFRALRVINDDRVQPGGGFGTHPHQDMEIISIVLEGSMQHRDGEGHGAVIRAGDVQLMSAGTGIQHSEFNASKTDPLRFLQIWIRPDRHGVQPRYAQLSGLEEKRRDHLLPVASPDGRQGSLTLHSRTRMYWSLLSKDASTLYTVEPGRGLWLHVIDGVLEVNRRRLHAADGAAVEHETSVRLHAVEPADFLLFDLG